MKRGLRKSPSVCVILKNRRNYGGRGLKIGNVGKGRKKKNHRSVHKSQKGEVEGGKSSPEYFSRESGGIYERNLNTEGSLDSQHGGRVLF